MTNYEVYFGTQERAIDSLSMLLEFPDHPRPEVRELQKEVHNMGVPRWLKAECINKRWWAGIIKEPTSNIFIVGKKKPGVEEPVIDSAKEKEMLEALKPYEPKE